MTVRVNKSAFNIREKLSELERPIGVKGNELIRAETAQDARDLVSAGRKNLIINGAMLVAQRATQVTSVTSAGYRTVDRFKLNITSLGAWTVDQSTDGPAGFTKSFKATCTTADASPGASDSILFVHQIEAQNLQLLDFGASGAKDATLSFWVKSNKTGTATVGVLQLDNSNKMVSFEYSISSADTWEYKTVTIPGDTSGVINDDNGAGLQFEWWLNGGSTYQSGSHRATWTTFDQGDRNPSNLGVGGAVNDYCQITGVQLEVGKNATEFEHRSYDEELALCERYFEKIWQNNNTASPDSGGNGFNTISPGVHNGSYGYYVFKFRTQKRVRPSLDHAGKFRVFGASSITDLTFNEFYSPGVDAARLRSAHSGSAGQGFILEFDGNNSSIGYISADAEL